MDPFNIFMLWIFGYILVIFPYGLIEIEFLKCRLRWVLMYLYLTGGAAMYIVHNWK